MIALWGQWCYPYFTNEKNETWVKYLTWSLKSVTINLIKWQNQYWDSGWVGCKNHLPKPTFFQSSIYQNACQDAPVFQCFFMRQAVFIYLFINQICLYNDNHIIWLLCWVDISATGKDLVLVGLCSLITVKFRVFWIIKSSCAWVHVWFKKSLLNEFGA